MVITMGSLLQRLERSRDSEERFSFFMPNADGPCRFGVYNLLHKIVLERQGWKERVRIWSPNSSGYFAGIQPGFTMLMFGGFMATDLLLEGLYYARPVETEKGAAEDVFRRYQKDLQRLVEWHAAGDLSTGNGLIEVATGRLFGITDLLRRAAGEYASIMSAKKLPTVLVVGEIYVRCDSFSNDFVIEKLEQRGIRARFAAFNEWLEYMDFINLKEGRKSGVGPRFSNFVQNRIQDLTYRAIADVLGWPERTTAEESVAAAEPYLRSKLVGEAVLTVGGPLAEHHHGHIDGVVSAGPLECMPNKIAEAQFFHAAEREGLLSLTLALNGDPVDPEVIDNFAYEVHARFRRRAESGKTAETPRLRPLSPMRLVEGLKRLPLPGRGRVRLPVVQPRE